MRKGVEPIFAMVTSETGVANSSERKRAGQVMHDAIVQCYSSRLNLAKINISAQLAFII